MQLQNKNINKKATATVKKNDLRYSKMSEGNTCTARPNLEVLPLCTGYVQAEDCNTHLHETLNNLVLFLYHSGVNCSIVYG